MIPTFRRARPIATGGGPFATDARRRARVDAVERDMVALAGEDAASGISDG